MFSRRLPSLLKNEVNALYKSRLTANRKRWATENVWGKELPRLGISVWVSYGVVSRVKITDFSYTVKLVFTLAYMHVLYIRDLIILFGWLSDDNLIFFWKNSKRHRNIDMTHWHVINICHAWWWEQASCLFLSYANLLHASIGDMRDARDIN